jgi:endoglycosylceramidase
VGDPGGAGGDAPGWLFGIGGHGGDGGTGGHGGDGGNGTGLFGNGGNGGDGGDGDNSSGLPALGGAGGNGGLLGSHGAVGHYGALTGAPSSTEGLLSTTGDWFTDADGKVVILHGFNEVIKVPPFEPAAEGFSEDDAAFLAAHGFNAVRVGVIWSAVEPQPGVFNDAYLASIENTVQTLADHGIVSLIDMHQDLYSSTLGGEGAPTWAVQTGDLPNIAQQAGLPNIPYALVNPAGNHAWDAFWANAEAPDGVGLENHYAQMWEYVANYFKGNPDVLGFDMMNEPWPGSQWLPSAFGSPFFGSEQLTPFYNQVASAIRAVDPTTPVFFEPNLLFGGGFPTGLGTVDDPHTAFSFHDYCELGALGTDAFCPWELGLVASQATAYAQARHIPALLTEFGATDDLANIATTMQVADQHQFGWMYWAYSNGEIDPAAAKVENLVFDTSQPPVGDNVDTAKLDTLDEPYPQVVAGTPNSWSFDSDTYTFTLSYSTERADGSGDFAAGTTTTISVPAIEYPNGYQVSVTGGHVFSDSNAPVLIIESDLGAKTVNVTVSPGAGGASAG